MPPEAERSWWYQYYFATERGRAGCAAHRRDFARLIWRSASPAWRFDDATFERSAAAFDNPDHVAIVIHNYRWRIGLAADDPELDALEQRLVESAWEGWPGIRSPQAKEYLAKYQVTAEGWYVANDLTVAETRRLRRIGEAADQFLDAIGD